MLSFLASPDQGVSPGELHQAFEDTLATVAAAGIPEATFSRIRQRRIDELKDSGNPSAIVFNEAVRLLSLLQQPIELADLVSRGSKMSRTNGSTS